MLKHIGYKRSSVTLFYRWTDFDGTFESNKCKIGLMSIFHDKEVFLIILFGYLIFQNQNF